MAKQRQARVLIGYDDKDGRHEIGDVVTVSETLYDYLVARGAVTDDLGSDDESAHTEDQSQEV